MESDADQDSSYEAVSYTWGPPGGNYTILVNCREMAVRYNLWQLLSDLQTQANENQKDRRLWIDAICIDQNAEVEKSRQIPRMGIIYRRARRVLVWLGPEAREAQWAMDFVDSSWARAGMIYLIAFFRSVMSSAWWGRLWVVQEAAAASKVVV
ncbi:heterokaryon incompatibility, partial [Bisporella sp. PMI_857]